MNEWEIAAVVLIGVTNFLYSFAHSSYAFAVVHALNGLAYGAVTTLYMAFYVDSLAADEVTRGPCRLGDRRSRVDPGGDRTPSPCSHARTARRHVAAHSREVLFFHRAC